MHKNDSYGLHRRFMYNSSALTHENHENFPFYSIQYTLAKSKLIRIIAPSCSKCKAHNMYVHKLLLFTYSTGNYDNIIYPSSLCTTISNYSSNFSLAFLCEYCYVLLLVW